MDSLKTLADLYNNQKQKLNLNLDINDDFDNYKLNIEILNIDIDNWESNFDWIKEFKHNYNKAYKYATKKINTIGIIPTSKILIDTINQGNYEILEDETILYNGTTATKLYAKLCINNNQYYLKLFKYDDLSPNTVDESTPYNINYFGFISKSSKTIKDIPFDDCTRENCHYTSIWMYKHFI